MSNISQQTCIFFLCLAALMGSAWGAMPKVDRERLEDIVDDSLLSRAAERPAWDYLFGILRNCTEKELEQAIFADVGFVELSRQPKEYRGKIVKIRGTLLRCNFIKSPKNESPFDDVETTDPLKPVKPDGFYESWILLSDERHIPISVCSLEIPVGMPTGDDIDEKVEVIGFFYKRQLYLSDQSEEVSTPTILAKTLRWTPTPLGERKAKPGEKPFLLQDAVFWQMILLIVAAWLVLRIMSRRWRVERKPIKFEFSDVAKKDDEKIVIPEIKDTPEQQKDPPEQK